MDNSVPWDVQAQVQCSKTPSARVVVLRLDALLLAWFDTREVVNLKGYGHGSALQ